MRNLVYALLILLFSLQYAAAQERIGLVRNNNENARLIVFVHGYGSNGEKAWTNQESGVFWPDLVAQDNDFIDYDIFVFDYFTKLNAGEQQASVHGIRSQLQVDMGLLDYGEIVFIGHSMGGIIIRDLLNRDDDIASRTTAIVTYASPYEGSIIVSLATYLVTRNPQPLDLVDVKNSYLKNLETKWLYSNKGIPLFCAYELEETYGFIVVTQSSATRNCWAPHYAIQSDHSGVVKPADVDSMPHKFLRGALRKIAGADEDVPQEYFSVNGTIWAEGTRRVPYNDLFVVKAPRDGSTCSRRIERRPHRFCPTFEGRPLQIERLELGAPEGNDGFATAEITDGGLCVTAYVTSIDDGRGTFGDCRGRSWLNRQEIRFFGFSRVPNSSSKQQRVDTIIDVGTDGNYSYSQQYAGQPQDFEDLIWKYNLNVTRFLNDELASSFSLSTSSPTSDTMISAIDGGLLSLTGD